MTNAARRPAWNTGAVAVPIEIALAHRVGCEAVEHRAGDVAEDRHHRAHHHHAIGVEQRGVEILLFADERADRGAFQQRVHLRLRRADGAADDLQPDRIEHQSATNARYTSIMSVTDAR
jgi:hypothetical protein